MNRLKYLLLLVTALALILGLFTAAAQDEKVLVIGLAEQTDSYDPGQWFHLYHRHGQSRHLQPVGHLPQ